ncbi:MAG: hypothetical protein NXI18_21290 [Alphaproteobacteria bacterium]|nr:hypothetical protein [Alphaproteobacteria bacterium]
MGGLFAGFGAGRASTGGGSAEAWQAFTGAAANPAGDGLTAGFGTNAARGTAAAAGFLMGRIGGAALGAAAQGLANLHRSLSGR